MQQIKNDLVPLHGSVMKDGIWGIGAAHTGQVVTHFKRNQNKTKPITIAAVPSNAHSITIFHASFAATRHQYTI